MTKLASEIQSNMERSALELQRAKDLFVSGQFGASAARAADAALYCATALLLDEEIELGQHGDVITLIDQMFVQKRRLTEEQGEKLRWIFQLGKPKNPGNGADLLPAEAQKAIEFAQSFMEATKVILAT